MHTTIPLKQSYKWLALAVAALGLSGLLSIVIVLLRTPVINQYLPAGWFRASLVVHVDLSVLIWLLAMGATIISAGRPHEWLSKVSYTFAASAVALLVLAWILGGKPILNNYIPMLENLPFALAIALWFTAIFLQLIAAYNNSSLIPGVNAQLLLIFIGAMSSMIWAFEKLKHLTASTHLIIHDYYELLFWGSGHLLQFFYTHLLLAAWYLLSNSKKEGCRWWKAASWTNVGCALPVVLYLPWVAIDSSLYQDLFTEQMKWLGGVAPLVALGSILYFNDFKKVMLRSYYLWSIILFLTGGSLGLLINEINVTIPAHYHGSIIGITVALMGVTVWLISLTRPEITKHWLVKWQPNILAIGQVLHIGGLAISGGYGALRKTPGEVLGPTAKFAMGIMGIGGLLAVMGGIMFVGLIWRFWPSKT